MVTHTGPFSGKNLKHEKFRKKVEFPQVEKRFEIFRYLTFYLTYMSASYAYIYLCRATVPFLKRLSL